MNLHAVPAGHRPLTDQQMRGIVGFLEGPSAYRGHPRNRRVRITRTRIYANCPNWGRFVPLSHWTLQGFAPVGSYSPWNPDDPRIEWRDA